jgi:hypothetical protein
MALRRSKSLICHPERAAESRDLREAMCPIPNVPSLAEREREAAEAERSGVEAQLKVDGALVALRFASSAPDG